jgi:alcohol dehydrogenase YqhD (iron-dependent ADH family)
MDGAEAAIEALEKFFFETLGLKKTLTELNITDEHFAEMAESSCHGGVMHSLKDLMPKDVEAIYPMCL